MRHMIIAVVIGLVTIGLSIFLLSDDQESFDGDLKPDKTIVLGEEFMANNYDITAQTFECDDHTSIAGDETRQGCILTVELTNTTIFDQALILDGDFAVGSTGMKYESSDDLSRRFIEDNGLVNEVDVEQTVTGGVFFEVPEDAVITTIEVYESATSDPIIISI